MTTVELDQEASLAQPGALIEAANVHLEELHQDGRKRSFYTVRLLRFLVDLAKRLFEELRVGSTERERRLRQFLLDADQVATLMGWGDGRGATGLCDEIDRKGVPYKSQSLADQLAEARMLLTGSRSKRTPAGGSPDD
ncbi:MAG: hypothetical protein V3U03_17375 [Myxococcota bacterium]